MVTSFQKCVVPLFFVLGVRVSLILAVTIWKYQLQNKVTLRNWGCIRDHRGTSCSFRFIKQGKRNLFLFLFPFFLFCRCLSLECVSDSSSYTFTLRISLSFGVCTFLLFWFVEMIIADNHHWRSSLTIGVETNTIYYPNGDSRRL